MVKKNRKKEGEEKRRRRRIEKKKKKKKKKKKNDMLRFKREDYLPTVLRSLAKVLYVDTQDRQNDDLSSSRLARMRSIA